MNSCKNPDCSCHNITSVNIECCDDCKIPELNLEQSQCVIKSLESQIKQLQENFELVSQGNSMVTEENQQLKAEKKQLEEDSKLLKFIQDNYTDVQDKNQIGESIHRQRFLLVTEKEKIEKQLELSKTTINEIEEKIDSKIHACNERIKVNETTDTISGRNLLAKYRWAITEFDELKQILQKHKEIEK